MDYFKMREKAYKYLSIGTKNFYEGNYKLAEENFNKVLSLKYSNASIESYYYLSFIKDICGDYETAEDYFKQGISIEPIDDKAFVTAAESGPINFYQSIAEEFCKQCNYDMAIKCNNKILKFAPESPSAYCNISIIKSYEKKFDEAIQYINKAIELYFKKHNKSNDLYYFYRGNYNSALNYLENANDDYTKVIELNPYSSDAFKERAKINIKLNNYSQAKCDLEKSLELNPYDGDAKKILNEIIKTNYS